MPHLRIESVVLNPHGHLTVVPELLSWPDQRCLSPFSPPRGELQMFEPFQNGQHLNLAETGFSLQTEDVSFVEPVITAQCRVVVLGGRRGAAVL